jgi:hypothetical protein
MKFLKKLFNPHLVGIEAIKMDTLDWPEIERKDSHIIWRSEDYPAQLSLHFFPQAPDVPGEVTDPLTLQKFYRKKILKQGGGLLHVDRTRIEGFFAIDTLFKIPMKEQGLVYVASYTFPFARYGYVIKLQAQEFFDFGGRERLVLEKLGQEGELQFDESGNPLDWEGDPYDPDHKLGTLMNKADEVKYDLFFKEHPLTRVREYMYRVRNSLKFDESLTKLEPYPTT